MSTIRVDNFAPSAGGTEFGIEGIAKSLLVYDQTSNSIEEQVNVSSVTDQATGRFSANHTNNFSNTDQPYTHYGESSERFIDPTRFVSASAMHTTTRNSSLAYQDYDNNQLIRCGGLA